MASPGSPVIMLRDTRARQVKVRVSFGLALFGFPSASEG